MNEDNEEEQEDYLEQQQELQDEQNLLREHGGAYDNITLQEKNIEPDNSISGALANRNTQLGNIGDRTFKEMELKYQTAIKLYALPKNCGGFLAHKVAENLIMENDMGLLLSNSKEGFARRQNNTSKNIIEKIKRKNDIKNKINKGFNSRLE